MPNNPNRESPFDPPKATETADTPETPETSEACGCGNNCGNCEGHDPETSEIPVPEVIDLESNAKYNEMLDRYQRCLAEFDNYRKRTTKEMAARYDDGLRAACDKLLPIVDNFERAMAAHDNPEDTFFQGVALIARQFDNMLSDLGVQSIATEPGDPFDTNLHHAVAHTEDENFNQNSVAMVLQKGYTHKDRVLRYAMVKVAN